MRRLITFILLTISVFAFSANNYWRGTTNSNWGTNTNWSLNVVPTSNDGNIAVFDASSPNCSVNVSAACNAIDFTGYTGNIAMLNFINVYGNITLSSGMTISSSSYFLISANSILTSNGKYIPYLRVNQGITITLVGDCSVGSMTEGSGSSATTINKTTNEVLTLGGITAQSYVIQGNALINLQGTVSGNIASNVNINGDLTFSSGTYFAGSVTYSSGAINSANVQVYFLAGSSINGWTNANYLENAFFQGAGTISLNSNFYCRNLNIGTTTNALTLNGNAIYAQSLNSSFTSGTSSGTTVINLNGLGYIVSSTGISNTINTATPTINKFTGATNANTNTATNWSQGSVPSAFDGYLTQFASDSPNTTVNATLNCNAIDFINYIGTITMTNGINVYGNITLGSGMNVSGVSAINSLFTSKWKSNGVSWPNSWGINKDNQINLLEDNITVGRLTYGATQTTLNGNILTCTNGVNLGYNSPLRGTTIIKVTGGTISTGSDTRMLQNDIQLDGNVAFGTYFSLLNSSLNYLSGSITTTGSNFVVSNSIFTIPNTIIYNNLIISGTGTYTLPGNLVLNGIFQVNSCSPTFSGSYTITSNGVVLSTTIGSIVLNLSSNIISNGLVNLNNNTNSPSSTINNFKIIANSGLTCSGTVGSLGTSEVSLTGGTWSGSGIIGNNLTLDGNLTISGSVYYRTGVLKKQSGNITLTGSTINIPASATLDLAGLTLNNLTLNNFGVNVTLKSNFGISGALTSTASTSASHNKFLSDVGGTQRKITLLNGSTHDLSFVDFQDIDSGDSYNPVATEKGTIANCKNIYNILPFIPCTSASCQY